MSQNAHLTPNFSQRCLTTECGGFSIKGGELGFELIRLDDFAKDVCLIRGQVTLFDKIRIVL